MPYGNLSKPYLKWSDRKEIERLSAIELSLPKKPGEHPRKITLADIVPKKPKRPLVLRVCVTCPECGTTTKPGAKFCGRSCSSRAARRGQLAWESSVADNLVAQGWEIISPTACCDRIGIRDGRIYFLEFKPAKNAELRSFQQSVRDIVPHMYRTVIGTRSAEVLSIRGDTVPDGKRTKNKEHTTSRFLGVSWEKSSKRWRVRIMINGKRMTIGKFKVEEDAARAYEDARRFLTLKPEPPCDGSL